MSVTKKKKLRDKTTRIMKKVGQQNAIVEAAGSLSSSPSTNGLQALTLNELRDQVFEWAQGKGWWDDEANRNIPSKLALVHSEVSEALEEYREGRMETYFTRKQVQPANSLVGTSINYRHGGKQLYVRTGEHDPWIAVDQKDLEMWGRLGYESKPEGFASEIADVFIRLADLCGYLNIDIDTEVKLKMQYNETRSYRHGGKKV